MEVVAILEEKKMKVTSEQVSVIVDSLQHKGHFVTGKGWPSSATMVVIKTNKDV